MRTLLLLIAVLTTSPAWAVPLTVDFTGTIAFTHGTVEGSWTYESTATPDAFNIRHLAPNVTYALTAWDMTVRPDFSDIPWLAGFPDAITFSSALANNTAEFCIGICIFSPQPYEGVRFFSGEDQLQLEFKIPSALLFLNAPPDTRDEWGALHDARNITVDGGASWLRTPQVIASLTDGGITGLSSSQAREAPVPEPSTWVLVLGGLLAVMMWQCWKMKV